MPHDLLGDLVLVYAVALCVMLAAGRAGVPAIIALIAAGVVAGPSALRLVSTPEEVDVLAEIGIALLLFTVGLDFPLGKLRQIWRAVVWGGTLQMAGTAVIAGAMAWAAGLPPRTAVFVGLFVALSSTAIVLNELGRRNRLDAPAGRLATGILLFQDLCVVLLLLAGPLLAGAVQTSAMPGVIGRAALALIAIVVMARLILPGLFRLVTASGQREAFPLAVLVGSLGTAAIGAALGLSMALGAFLAGLVLAGSEFSHQARAEVRPMRDLLTSLFFVSVGMLIDVSVVALNLPLILAIALVAVVIKALVAAAALASTGSSLRISAVAALYLAQVGEFSFVLGRDALELGVLSTATWQLLLPASILTMLVAPFLVAVAPRLGDRLVGIGPAVDMPDTVTEEGPVLVLGFGIGGRLVANALRSFDKPYQVIDLNGATVRDARAAGERISYGDATAPDTLLAAGLSHARALVVLLSDPDAALQVAQTAKRLAPAVPVIVRTRYRAEAARLEQAGAIAVVEELEASLEVLALLLTQLKMPGNVVQTLIGDYRRREVVPPRFKVAPHVRLDALAPELLSAPVATHQIQPGDQAADRSLRDLNLHAATGTSVLAVRRAGRYITSPAADLYLASGDTLYLIGAEADVELARHLLTTG